MIEETGFVSRLEGQYAWVSSQVKSGCGSCSANKSCGTSSLSQYFGHKSSDLKMLNPIHAEVGQSIVFGLQESDLLIATFVHYALPLLSLMIGMLLAHFLFPFPLLGMNDFFAFSGAVIGLWVGLLSAKSMAKKSLSNGKWQPIILRLNTFSIQFN